MPNPSSRTAAVLVAIALLAACGGNDTRHVQANVAAGAGGVFSDDPAHPSLTVRIPAGALPADAVLDLEEVKGVPSAGTNQVAAGAAWRIALSARAGGAAPTLSQPMQIELATDRAPVHPQLGEIARLSGDVWQRASANFYRPATQVVVALTTDISGTYRATLRSLQRASGPAVDRGFQVFMDETFGNELFFGDVVGLHTVLNGVAPAAAVQLGAQVDLAKVPADVAAVMTGADLAAKDAALLAPAVTRKLIKAGAVVGVKGFYATSDVADDQMIRVGITCALCHQLVKPTSFDLSSGPAALPIGPLEMNGVPNGKMDAGKILSLTQFAVNAGQPTVDLLAGWGANRFDVRALPDNAFEDSVNNPTDTPPLWNFMDLEAAGYPFGWDGLFAGQDALASQAEAVYDVVLHANGAFGTASGTLPPALRISPPQRILDGLAQAETLAFGNDVDRQKLLDLQEWMRSMTSPAPGAFDETKAEQGFGIFHGKGACNTCHTTPELSGTKSGPFLANITAVPAAGDLAGGIKVPGLRGVSQTAPYFHDDSATTLAEAVERVATVVSGVTGASFSADEKAALVEYLKSL
jgi:cytochrome c2